MRRTTICRSERGALLALVAGLLVGLGPAVRAQDTTQARRDTTKAAAPDTTPPAGAAAPNLAGAPAQLPATHTVAKGETLWSIAQLYYNDPLLWPELYRLNTAVIDDPHWIYPGEDLNLAQVVSVAQAPPESTAAAAPQVTPAPTPADTVHAVQPTDTVTAVAVAPPDTTVVVDTAQSIIEAPPPPPAAPLESYRTVFDRRITATQEVRDVLRAYVNQPYRPVRRGEFYSAGFLTENESFPWGQVVGNTAAPAIPEFVDRTGAFQYDEIAIVPPVRASYHVGDSLLIVRIDRQIGGWGDVVVPAGVARVTAVQRRQVLARVVMQFARILGGGYRTLPLEPFRDPGAVRPTAVARGLEGVLVAVRDLHVLTIEQQIVFLNRGRAEGVTLGDVFEVYRPAAGAVGTASEEAALVVEVVHTREHSSSGLVLNRIQHPDLVPGMPARLIRKMPS
ncbi:MAG TPA: LysM peptidoglycan-binding domain-containing protein [Gemmatimonadales bacterium]|nr:LysM peptidoglycan-binding domain-containing protein [Gemmatimonadales bacterium]